MEHMQAEAPKHSHTETCQYDTKPIAISILKNITKLMSFIRISLIYINTEEQENQGVYKAVRVASQETLFTWF